MDYFQKFKSQIQFRIIWSLLLTVITVVLTTWVVVTYTTFNLLASLLALASVLTLVILLVSQKVTQDALKPLETTWKAFLYIDSDRPGSPAPNLDDLKTGHELTGILVGKVYQLANQPDPAELIEHRKQISQAANVVERLPIPLFVFNKELLVTNASSSAIEYCQTSSSALFGVPIFENLILEFSNDYTLESWIKNCQDNKITDTAHWDRVHVLSKESNEVIKQCDIVAYYNKDNQSGAEFIVTLFDRTDLYNSDDNALGFVAMAVHELRTPITMLRGYIEVFQSEIGDTLNDELSTFMVRMESSAKHLSSFVSNILNVARIEQNQLTLHLKELPWEETLKESVKDAELRAKIFHKTIEYNIAQNLPTVAVDKVSIYEVLNNLLENAIKYSGESQKIIVSTSLDKEGNVQTTIQDFGAGISASVLPTLFEKFSRNHRTKNQVSGTGLGLYLSHAIIKAHGGQIWASSKEGEGSTFGFTLVPFDRLDEARPPDDTIERPVNGWIKNHSLYKR